MTEGAARQGQLRAWERPALIRLDVDQATRGGVAPSVNETGHNTLTTHTFFSTSFVSSDVRTFPGVLS